MPEPLEPRCLLTGPPVSPAAEPLELLSTAAIELPDSPVTTSAGVQQMPSVAVNPLDADHVVIVYMDYALLDTGYGGLGVAVSRDGGQTWQNGTIPLPAGFDQGASDPVVQFDDQGRVFVSFMAIKFLAGKPSLVNPAAGSPRVLGMQANSGIFVARSNDGGLSWDAVNPVASDMFDGTTKVFYETVPDLAIDTIAELPGGDPSPTLGNLYVTWTRFYPAGQFPGQPDATGGSDVMIAVSEDHGQTWQIRTKQPQPETGVQETVLQGLTNNGRDAPEGRGFMVWPQASVGAGGDVYVADFFGAWFAVSHSNDAAASFFVPTRQDRFGLPFGPSSKIITAGLTNNALRTLPVRAIAADPVRPGHVYVAEPLPVLDAVGNLLDAADIFFARSTDYGRTWQRTFLQREIRADVVNDDNGGQKAMGADDDVVADQFMVELQVNARGDVGLVWYDTRRDPANHTLDVFGAISTDGGRSFSPNFRVTDESFDANRGRFTDATGAEITYLGDAVGLALAADVGYAAWTDTRAGNQDIYFRRLPLTPPPAPPNDQFEPNEASSAATDIGEVVAPRQLGRLGLPTGDEDWFLLKSPATGRLTVTASGTAGVADLQIEIRDAAGQQILATSNAVFDSPGHFFGQQVTVASASGESYLVHVVGAQPVGQYALTLESLTDNLGQLVQRRVDGALESGDETYYSLESVATGAITARLTPLAGAGGEAALELLDGQDHTKVLAKSTGSEPQVNLAVTEGQKLLVRVSGTGASAFAGPFRLELANLDQFSAPGRNVLHFAAGAGPSQEVVEDFNRDGRADIAIANALANVVSVSLGNGDGTFSAPRQFAVGAFRTPNPVGDDAHLNTYRRDILAPDFNGDGIVDLAVTNYDSSDVSILLGQGDGTFQSQRRFDAASFPFGLAAGDVNNDGHLDLVVIDTPEINVPNQLAVLLGRGDGTFAPQKLQELPFILFLAVVALGDLDEDGTLDLIAGGGINEGLDIFHGQGDGTFTFTQRYSGSRQATDLIVRDFTGDGHLDVVATSLSDDNGVVLLPGNGHGGFGEPTVFFAGQGPLAVEAVDWGSEIDGHLDLIVANSGVIPGPVNPVGAPGVVVLPGLVDASGNFKEFGEAQDLAAAEQPLDVEVRDFNADGTMDVSVVDRGGFFVIFGRTPTIPANATRETARGLGSVVHLVQPTLTITTEHNDAWYRLSVPTEMVPGAGDQILDFSGGFAAEEGLGLRMEVLDAAGSVLGFGERLRVVAEQGQALWVHVFGVADGAVNRGAGAYTLAIDVLPQLVTASAEALLPGQGTRPGGPTTSIVLVFQGDRLDAGAAENPENYRVTWLGRDGVLGTGDDRQIPVGDGLAEGQQSAVYDASSNVDIASGLILPTAIRQTVTLLFGKPLPAGSYQIEVLPSVQADPFNMEEADLLTQRNGFSGHAVATASAANVVEGSSVQADNLVRRTTTLGDLSQFETGTAFLTQFIGDLGALLDAQLTELGDDSDITGQILEQIVAQLGPALGAIGRPLVSLAVFFLDPPSIGVIDPARRSFIHDRQSNLVANNLPQTYVGAAGNVTLLVMANPQGRYQLHVADTGPLVRGGVVYFGNGAPQITLLTQRMRTGEQSFSFDFPRPLLPTPVSPGPAPTVLRAAPLNAALLLKSQPAAGSSAALATNTAGASGIGGEGSGGDGAQAARTKALEAWEWLAGGLQRLWNEIRQRIQVPRLFGINFLDGIFDAAAPTNQRPAEQLGPPLRPDGDSGPVQAKQAVRPLHEHNESQPVQGERAGAEVAPESEQGGEANDGDDPVLPESEDAELIR